VIVLSDDEAEKQQASAKKLRTDDASHPSDLQSADCQDSSKQREVARESLLSADQYRALSEKVLGRIGLEILKVRKQG
jgi:hypothetical protein